MMKSLISAALLSLCWTLPASAAIVTFQQGISPTNAYAHLGQDFRGSGNINTAAQMLVGNQPAALGGNLQIRTVLGFDLSAIPAGSTINSITLRLVSDGSQSGTIAGVGAINLHEVIPNGVATNNMVEGQVSATLWQTGSNWTTTLGDFTATPLTAATLNNANANTVLDTGETATFGTSLAFVNATQAALNAGLPLEMILIAPDAEANNAASNFFRFRSDDFATTPADRPLLTIDYTAPIPEPSFAVAGILTVAGLFGWQRFRQSHC
jgi:hypothetical protein